MWFNIFMCLKKNSYNQYNMKTSIHSFTLIAFIIAILTSFTNEKINTRSKLTEYSAIAKAPEIKLMSESEFRGVIDGKEVSLYTLRNKRGMVTQITNFGGKVLNLWTPDKDGNFDDVVTGFASFEAFKKARGSYFGALIGRYGNRIA